MDLMCIESPHFGKVLRAPSDSTILGDRTVMAGMLDLQSRYTVTCDYCRQVQTEVLPPMRKVLAQWMSEVCEEQSCEDIVFPCAMNYVDRFLASTDVKKTQLQLLGAVCLLISSKMRTSRPLALEALVYYTDYSVTAEELKAWELLVLSKLNWDMASVVANDFVDHLLCCLGVSGDRDTVRRHANTFISLCATEYRFTSYSPSLLASASVAAAIHGLNRPLSCPRNEVVTMLEQITHVEADQITQCVQDIEVLMATSFAAFQQPPHSKVNSPSTAYASTKLSSNNVPSTLDSSQPNTPTDVQDVNF